MIDPINAPFPGANLYSTRMIAWDNVEKDYKVFSGREVYALTARLAQEWCNEHASYLQVLGRVNEVMEGKEAILYDAQSN